MLTQLHIENIAVIEKADIEFGKGLTVLTGETGAGKSIIVDSLGAVLGARTSRELVRTGAEYGVVSAVFETDAAAKWFEDNDFEPEDEVIIRRKISADGKNNCRVCGNPVTVSQLRQLGSLLLDIHGQNDGRQLMDEDSHLAYLDGFGKTSDELAAFVEAYREYTACKREMDKLSMDEVEKERLADNLRYRIEELENAQLKVGEEDELIARRDLLRNSEKLTEALDGAYSALYACDENAGALVDEASALISKAALISDELRETADIIGNASSLIYDAAERIRDFRDGLEFSPDEYDRIETRTNQLRRLGRKYNADEEGMLKILDDSRRELAMLEYSDDMLKKLEKQLNEHKDNCTKKAAALTVCRKKAAEKLEARICSELRDLSMPSVRFKVSVEPMESVLGFDKTGADEVRFLISANAGMELGRISKIASGGELSRIMLAMKTAFSDNDPIETMVFDEIDTGVSGVAAQRVGEKMSDLSRGKQVLCITHLPQIAALADSHDKIEKAEKDGKTFTVVKELDRQGRRMELARLYGGDVITETTLAGAEEQLAAADKYKLTRND
ncbi:MAG: DNA repair protein RecN [Firmicutes bacterium]|nr:DNA repair protein RecN [Bacillota bacterium]